MSWQNQSGGGDKNNPWGRGGRNNGGGRNPWGGNGGGPSGRPPDMEDILRRAQENFKRSMPGFFNTGKILGLFILVLVALWLASGFYIIEPGVHGVVQRFGEWNRTKTEEGLGYHLPWPVETVTQVNVSEMRRMGIGFTEIPGRNGGVQIRDISDESLMLTSDANIINLDLVVLWNVKSAEQYLFNIRDPENTIKKVAESAIREVVGQTPMFSIITTERSQVAQEAKEIMMQNLDEYKSGIHVTQVLIQEAEVHPDVQNAFQDVQSAKQDAIDTQNQAQAYREGIIPKARGQATQMKQQAQAYRESVTARARGDADRFNSVYQAYLSGKDVTKKRMYLETMEDVLKNSQKIILDQEQGGQGVLPYLPLTEMKPAGGQPRNQARN